MTARKEDRCVHDKINFKTCQKVCKLIKSFDYMSSQIKCSFCNLYNIFACITRCRVDEDEPVWISGKPEKVHPGYENGKIIWKCEKGSWPCGRDCISWQTKVKCIRFDLELLNKQLCNFLRHWQNKFAKNSNCSYRSMTQNYLIYV